VENVPSLIQKKFPMIRLDSSSAGPQHSGYDLLLSQPVSRELQIEHQVQKIIKLVH
jgi:hypothetical protein